MARTPSPTRGVKTIESLQRGLEVMHAIEQASAISLTELHRQTGLAKATLLRILKTLQAAGRVQRNELESRYVPRARSFGIEPGFARVIRRLVGAGVLRPACRRQPELRLAATGDH